MPVFNTEHQIRIRQGRHPLLDKKKVVPIDIQLGIDTLGGIRTRPQLIEQTERTAVRLLQDRHDIQDAKRHITEDKESFEDLLANLENSRVTIEKERLEIAGYKEEVKALKQKLEAKQEKIDQAKEKILLLRNMPFRILNDVIRQSQPRSWRTRQSAFSRRRRPVFPSKIWRSPARRCATRFQRKTPWKWNRTWTSSICRKKTAASYRY